MRRILFALCTVLLTIGIALPDAAANPTAAAEETEPNVVVLLTDSLDWQTIADPENPQLAAWAASGTLFNIVPTAVGGWVCPADLAMEMSSGKELSRRTLAQWATCPMETLQPGQQIPSWSYWFSRMQRARRYTAMANFGTTLQRQEVTQKSFGYSAGVLLLDAKGQVPKTWSPAPEQNRELGKEIAAAAQTTKLTVADISATNFSLDPGRMVAAQRQLFRKMPEPEDPESNPAPDPVPERDSELVQVRKSVTKANAARLEAVLEQIPAGTKVYVLSVMNVAANQYLQPGFVSFKPATASNETAVNAGSELGRLSYGWDPQVRQMGTVELQAIAPAILKDVISTDLTELPNFVLRTDPMRATGDGATTCTAGDTCFAERIVTLQDKADKAEVVRRARGPFNRSIIWSTTIYLLASVVLLAPRARSAYQARRDQLTASPWEKFRVAARMQINKTPSRRRFVVGARRIWAQLLGKVRGWGKAFLERHPRIAARIPVVRERIRQLAQKIHRFLNRVRKAFFASNAPVAWKLIGLTISAVPVSSHLIALRLSWWRSSNPQLAMVGSSWLLALVLAVALVLLTRKHRYLSLAVIGALTAVTLTADVLTGSKALTDSPIGFSTIMGARFYGLGNEAFALLGSGLLMSLAIFLALATRWRLSRIAAAIVAALIGAAVLFVVISPTRGADFGGALALTPAIAALALLLSGRRPSVKKVFITAVGAVVIAFGVAVLDWLRGPGERTHLGNFIQAIFDGDAGAIVSRKIAVNMRLLFSLEYRWIVLITILLIVLVVYPYLRVARAVERSLAISDAPKQGSAAQKNSELEGSSAPARKPRTTTSHSHISATSALKYGLIATCLCMAVAFAVNDSGIVLPGMGSVLVGPALAAELSVAIKADIRSRENIRK